MCSLKHVTALTSATRHIPAVNIIQLTTEVALQTLVARPREEVTLSGPGFRKNKEMSHLGTEALGTTVAQPGLVQSSPILDQGYRQQRLPLDQPIRPCVGLQSLSYMESLLAISPQRITLCGIYF